jgi:hypothetical protein
MYTILIIFIVWGILSSLYEHKYRRYTYHMLSFNFLGVLIGTASALYLLGYLCLKYLP